MPPGLKRIMLHCIVYFKAEVESPAIKYTSVNFKEGESLNDVRRREEKQLKKDFILFDFWYENRRL